MKEEYMLDHEGGFSSRKARWHHVAPMDHRTEAIGRMPIGRPSRRGNRGGPQRGAPGGARGPFWAPGALGGPPRPSREHPGPPGATQPDPPLLDPRPGRIRAKTAPPGRPEAFFFLLVFPSLFFSSLFCL